MLSPDEPRHTVATALKALSPFEQTLLKSYYIDGDSVPMLMHHHQMKRRDILNHLEAALVSMRAALRSRRIRHVSDVI